MSKVVIDSFKHIRRMHDRRFPHEIAVIMPGEYFVSREPTIVYTVLGSCISACVVDPVLRIGGMNHFMLPVPKENGRFDSWGESARYGSYAMELLINEILKRGGERSRLEVKVFGGAKIYSAMNNVGVNNAVWVLEYLAREGLKLVRADIGDIYPRKVYYFTETGQVLMKKVERVKNRTILEREQTYGEKLKQQKHEGDVELF